MNKDDLGAMGLAAILIVGAILFFIAVSTAVKDTKLQDSKIQIECIKVGGNIEKGICIKK